MEHLQALGEDKMNMSHFYMKSHHLSKHQYDLCQNTNFGGIKCKSSISMQSKIFKFWDQYEEGDQSTFHLLRACSGLYGTKLKNYFIKYIAPTHYTTEFM